MTWCGSAHGRGPSASERLVAVTGYQRPVRWRSNLTTRSCVSRGTGVAQVTVVCYFLREAVAGRMSGEYFDALSSHMWSASTMATSGWDMTSDEGPEAIRAGRTEVSAALEVIRTLPAMIFSRCAGSTTWLAWSAGARRCIWLSPSAASHHWWSSRGPDSTHVPLDGLTAPLTLSLLDE